MLMSSWRWICEKYRFGHETRAHANQANSGHVRALFGWWWERDEIALSCSSPFIQFHIASAINEFRIWEFESQFDTKCTQIPWKFHLNRNSKPSFRSPAVGERTWREWHFSVEAKIVNGILQFAPAQARTMGM